MPILDEFFSGMADTAARQRVQAAHDAITQKEHEQNAIAKDLHSVEDSKRSLLMDPGKLEKAVANMADFYSPTASTKKPKGEVYGLDSVEASKDKNDPTVGFGYKLRDDFTKSLMDPRYKGVPAGQLLQGLSQQQLATPDNTGRSLQERAHEFYRTEDSRWWGGVDRKKLPGYDAWKQDKLIQEKQANDKESWTASVEDTLKAGIGGAIMGAGGAAATGLAGAGIGALTGAAGGLVMGGPLGALIGGGIGAVEGGVTGVGAGIAAGALGGGLMMAGGELLAAPIKKLIHKTNWYQGMIQSNSAADNAKAVITDMASYLPGGMLAAKGMDRGLNKAFSGLEEGSVAPRTVSEAPPDLAFPGSGKDSMGYGPQRQISYDSSRTTTPGGGVLKDADGNIIMQKVQGEEPIAGMPGSMDKQLPPTPGGSGTIFGEDSTFANSTFTPELPKLLGEGKGYEWPGSKNLGRAETEPSFTPPVSETPRSQLLLDDLRGNSLDDFKKFEAEARGKVYTAAVPDGTSPVMSEDELFKVWQQRADNGIKPFNPYEKMIADNTATNNIVQTLQDTAKAKDSIAAKPTASNIVETVKSVPTEVKSVEGSDLVQKHGQLSSTGLQEAGFEPIIDPGITPLKGTVPDKINQAHERDTFTEIGKESPGGKLRTSISSNSAEETRSILNPVKNDEPAVEALTKIDPEVVTTPKQQEAVIKSVNEYTAPEKSVMEEFFPETKVQSLDEVKSKYYESLGVKNDTERLSQMKEEALSNLKADRVNEGSNIPITTTEIEKEFKLIQKDEPDNFKFWADDNKITLPDEVNKRNFKLIAGMMAFGLPAAGLYGLLAPDRTADASFWTALTAGAETVAKKNALMQGMLEKGLISKGVEKGQTALFKENIQTGLHQDPAELTKLMAANARAGSGAGAQYALMSPYQALESLFKTGAGKMVNVGTIIASFVTAGGRTKDNALRVFKNILSEGGIEAAPNQIKEATSHLVLPGARATKADIAAVQLRDSEKRLADFTAKLTKNTKIEDVEGLQGSIKVEQENIGKLKGDLEGLSGATKEFHDSWTSTMQKLVTDPVMGPSTRVSLSLEDPTRELYPWMPQLTRNEEVAVGKLRGLLDQYQGRLKARDIPTMDNYFPHSPHPEMTKIYNEELKDLLGGTPYQKFYSRTDSSRALLPDINYTMSHYLTDIEPRIQHYDAWEKSGLKTIMESPLIQTNPGMKRAFEQLYEGSKPAEQTWGNTAAKRYSEFEAVHQLFLSPSAGLKHLVKMTADIASVGPSTFLKSLPDTAGYVSRTLLNKAYGINQTSIRSILEKMGVRSDRFGRQLIDDVMDSAIMSGNMRKYMMDMGIESQDQIFNSAKNMWNKVQDVGSTWINVAELADRATSVSSALQMAAKKGMTVDQAMYGTYDLILKNNFLFSQFNPTWLNNPKIRAFLMFQATPFKIFERRGVMAQRSIENTKQLSSGISETLGKGLDKNTATTVQKMFGSTEGRQKLFDDLKNMRSYMRDGQSELKSNLFIDTLRQETDFFGTPIVRQMVTDMLTVGAATYGGAQAGLALSDHFFHIPFLSTQSEKGKMEVAVSPLVSGVTKGYTAWRDREPNEDFLLGSITKRWLGNFGPLPKTLEKAVRLSNNDIPDIYKKGGGSEYLKYFFGIPGKD
jgi:hypothetical protein